MNDETVEAPIATIGWLELFFDLIVVVSMALLAERLHEHADWSGAAMFVLLYVAIWLTWVSYVLYANVAVEKTQIGILVGGMAFIAVMAASIPEIDDRANVFAAGFLLCRLAASRGSLGTGKLLTAWPLLQSGGTSLVWIVAMWVDTPVKYYLWGGALAVDLGTAILRSRSSEEADDVVAAINARNQRQVERRTQRMAERQVKGELTREVKHPDRRRATIAFAPADIRVEHLDERLGVFVIIVLGEAVTQVVRAPSELEWNVALGVTAAAGFMLLVGLWRLTFSYGFAAAPNSQIASLPARLALPVHLVTTGAIVGLASALGEFTRHAHAAPGDTWRWIGCASLAFYFAATTAGALGAHAPRRWILLWGVPCILATLVIGLAGAQLRAEWLTVLLLATVSWQVMYGRIAARLAGITGD